MKKLLSVFLSAVMLATSLTATAFADTKATSAIKDTIYGKWDSAGLTSGTFYNVGLFL